jgi:hypothetical protein
MSGCWYTDEEIAGMDEQLAEVVAIKDSAITCLREIAAMGRKAGSERATQWLLQHGYPLEEGGYLPGKGFVDSHPPVTVRGEPMACARGKCADGYFGAEG